MALATLLSCGLHGCTNVNGGAVELSWRLEPTTDATTATTLDCTFDGREIDRIRLWWAVDGMPPSFHDFECQKKHGVTGFEVPPGPALLWLEPQCLSGTPVPTSQFVAPAPIQRTINVGDVVELHAVVIEIDVAQACL